MDLSWLEDFIALVESGNFSRAAERRHMTQPAFSRRIRALEDWVGAALFDRSLQPVVLTDAGRRFDPAAADVLRRIERARAEALAADRPGAAALRIAATHALSFTFLPAWLKRLEQRQVQPALHLISDSLQACERLMQRGQAQFLLCHRPAREPAARDGFAALRVGTDRLCLVAAPTLQRSAARLAYSPESGLGRIVASVTPQTTDAPVFTSHLAAVLRSMAKDGRGMAWLPESLIVADLHDGSLIRQDRPDIVIDICLVRPQEPQDGAAERFWTVACLEAHASDAHGS